MLFVHADEAELFERGEQGRTGAHGDARLAVSERAPHRVPFAFAEAAVDDGDAFAEPSPKAPDELRRERDFRHEHEHTAPEGEGSFRSPQVHLGFSGCRDALEQERARLALLEAFGDGADGALLSGIELGRRVRGRFDAERVDAFVAARDFDQPRLVELRDRRTRVRPALGECSKLAGAVRSEVLENFVRLAARNVARRTRNGSDDLNELADDARIRRRGVAEERRRAPRSRLEQRRGGASLDGGKRELHHVADRRHVVARKLLQETEKLFRERRLGVNDARGSASISLRERRKGDRSRRARRRPRGACRARRARARHAARSPRAPRPRNT